MLGKNRHVLLLASGLSGSTCLDLHSGGQGFAWLHSSITKMPFGVMILASFASRYYIFLCFCFEQEYHLKMHFMQLFFPRMHVRKLKTTLLVSNTFQDSEFSQHKEACVMNHLNYSQNIF